MDIDSGDIIHVADNNGISALQFNGTSYTALDNFGLPGISEVFVDSNDHIHVAHSGGLSAFTYNGSSYTAGAYFNVGGVVDITQTIPEPSSTCLILVGALVGVARRRRS
jgi:PEP-CTERM putative exosortase interaction domain